MIKESEGNLCCQYDDATSYALQGNEQAERLNKTLLKSFQLALNILVIVLCQIIIIIESLMRLFAFHFAFMSLGKVKFKYSANYR